MNLCQRYTHRVPNFSALRKDDLVAPTKGPQMKALQPASIALPFARYSHGVELPAGARIIRTSGQLGLQQDGTVPDGSQAQAEVCFANIAAILGEGGMGANDVCHINAFVTDRVHMAGYMAARDAFLADNAVLPSSTLMIVSGFTRPEFVVEIEVWAAKT
jgi:enamine deaminase RidA (YjgF/YER057c/UK114 family)